MDEIEQFIYARFKDSSDWLTGNCYYFSIILHERFPGGTIVYDGVAGHFLYLYNNKLYDWEGSHPLGRSFIPIDEIKIIDPQWYSHIYDGCIR